MRMPDSVYNDYLHYIKDGRYPSKEALQRMYDEIYYQYDDGAEMLRRLDSYQTKWTMNLHQ